jgi:hypothetical protein
MGIPSNLAASVPFSERYREFFSHRTPSLPDSIRPTATMLVNQGERLIISFENEIQRLHTEEGALLKLAARVALVAVGVALVCCNPISALLGAVAGFAFADRITACIDSLNYGSPFIKIAALAGAAIAACVASHFAAATYMAVAIAMLGQQHPIDQLGRNISDAARNLMGQISTRC